MIRVAVSGAAGKMGATTCGAIESAGDMELTAKVDPALGVELADVLADVDVVVDFTTPEAAPGNVQACLEAGVHAVVGTSGWDFEPLRQAAEAGSPGARAANVFVAPNFAIGAVLMIELARQAAAHMPDCEIVELHRAEKLDAPSGTAKHTAERIADAGAT
jgi:4-hydroxy-tetrahydrodipicolinate reductase